MNEEWRKIPGHPSYQVSNLGRVRGHKGRILALSDNGYGYLKVKVTGGATKKVHVLVARAFLPKPVRMLEQMPGSRVEVAHRNGDSHDNRADNLCWTKTVGNALHRRAHGSAPCPVLEFSSRRPRLTVEQRSAVARIASVPLQFAHRGAGNPSAKLTELEVVEIHRLSRRGWIQRRIASLFGVSDMQIHRIVTGKKWGHLHPDRRRR